jgi:ribosome biogenesis protein Tsr3
LVLTFGIVLQKDRVLVRHQLLAGFRQELLAAKEFSAISWNCSSKLKKIDSVSEKRKKLKVPCSWKHAEKLFDGLEGRPEVKLDFQLASDE